MQDSFANRLIETRKRLGLSQEDLAARIGTKGPAIGRYERGKTQPTLEVATRLADALSVSLDYLTGRTNVEPDPTTRARIEALAELPADDRSFVLRAFDSLVRDTRVRKAYA
jgi:transcriptional regulator with XRE-family HTH domain